MATYITIMFLVLIIAVCFDGISWVIGKIVETAKQIAWQRKEQTMATKQELLAQVSQLVYTVACLKDQIETLEYNNGMAFEATQAAPIVQCGTVTDMAAVANVPWFEGNVESDDTLADETTPALPVAHEPTRQYKVPARLRNATAIDNVLYTWTGRQGQSVYGMTVAMSQDGTVHAQIVDEVTLKAKSRVVTLPARAKRLGTNNAIAKQTAPAAAPTAPQTEPQDTTPKPHMIFTSKRTDLIARLDNGQINVASADDTGTAVAMIRRGFVPQAMTHEQLAQLVQSNPKHWTK